jgi:hypothetical protein
MSHPQAYAILAALRDARFYGWRSPLPFRTYPHRQHPDSREWHRLVASRMDAYNGVPYWEQRRLALLYVFYFTPRRNHAGDP